MAGDADMHRGHRLKLAEWGRAGLKQPRVTRMSIAVLAALVLAVTAAGTAAALTTSPSRPALAGAPGCRSRTTASTAGSTAGPGCR